MSPKTHHSLPEAMYPKTKMDLRGHAVAVRVSILNIVANSVEQICNTLVEEPTESGVAKWLLTNFAPILDEPTGELTSTLRVKFTAS